MNYIGEHLLPGQLGHFLLVLSLVTAVIATYSYYRATTSKLPEDQSSWKRLARIAFIIDAVSVFAIFGIIYYIVENFSC